MILTTYLTPILQFLILVGGGLQVAVNDGAITEAEGWQFVVLTLGAIASFIVPLSRGKWPALLKVLVAAASGAAVLVVDLIAAGGFEWNVSTGLLVAVAALNALAAEVGTDARLASARAAVADPNVDNRVVALADAPAYNVATYRLAA